MVLNIPNVRVTHAYGYTPSVPADDQMFGMVVECVKGEPNRAVLIRSPEQLYQEFKIRANAYFGVGGQALYVVRAACDTVIGGAAPVAATQAFFDTHATAAKVLKLEAKQKGSYEITLSVRENTTEGNNIIIEEDGYPSEYYIGVPDIKTLVKRINNESLIVNAYFKIQGKSGWYQEFTIGQTVVEGTGALATKADGTVLGSNTSDTTDNVEGSDGTVVTNSPEYLGQLPNSGVTIYAPDAHAKALLALVNYKLAGVFCMQTGESNVHAQYIDHADQMNEADAHGWRSVIIGAPYGAEKGSIVGAAGQANRETVLYVGQGVIDQEGNEYSPCEATQVVAGKIGVTPYYETIWGGQTRKRLSIDIPPENFISDIVDLPGETPGSIATRTDIIEYNERGVITFQKDFDGVRIREGVTTVQDNSVAEDELAVVRIVRHAKYLVYERAYEMLGQNITSTFKTDLEEYIKGALERMKIDDHSLIDIPENGLAAYNVSVQLIPRSVQRQGKVKIDISITPVHAAREIVATITVM